MGQDDLIRLDNVTKTYQAGAPPALAGAAQYGIRAGDVRAGRDGPARDCNHIDLPLGTGPPRQADGPDCQKGRVTSLHNHHGP